MGRSATRMVLAMACIGVAALAAACGSSNDAATDAASIDPLTETVPVSTIPADTPPEPGIFRLTGQPSLAFDLVRAGAALGIAGREGLSMRIRPAASDDSVLAALRSGEADAAVVSSDEALALASRGADLRIVLLLTTVTSGEAVLARADVGDVTGLVGRGVAYAAGTDGELLLRGVLAANDVPVTQVQLVRSGGRSPSTLLLDGSVDAAVTDGVRVLDTQAADPSLVSIATAGDEPGLLSRVLVVREEAVRTRPGQLLAFVRAWQALYDVERDDPEAVAASIAALQAVPVEDVTAELEGSALYDVPANAVDLLPGGQYFDQTLRQIDAAASAAGWLAAPVDPRALIDGAFAQAVASAR
ncbi:MAG: ABC transporter substrate-binding protein [Gaiellales bacterium]